MRSPPAVPFGGNEVGITPAASFALVIDSSMIFEVLTELSASFAEVTEASAIFEVVTELSASLPLVIAPFVIVGFG